MWRNFLDISRFCVTNISVYKIVVTIKYKSHWSKKFATYTCLHIPNLPTRGCFNIVVSLPQVQISSSDIRYPKLWISIHIIPVIYIWSHSLYGHAAINSWIVWCMRSVVWINIDFSFFKVQCVFLFGSHCIMLMSKIKLLISNWFIYIIFSFTTLLIYLFN